MGVYLRLSFKNTVPCLFIYKVCPGKSLVCPFRSRLCREHSAQCSLLQTHSDASCPLRPLIITVAQPAHAVRVRVTVGARVFPTKLVHSELAVFNIAFQAASKPSSSGSQMQGCSQKQ